MDGIANLTKKYDLSLLLKESKKVSANKELQEVAEEFESLFLNNNLFDLIYYFTHNITTYRFIREVLAPEK